MMPSPSLTEKRRAVERILIDGGSTLVAFSGGVDSTVLAALARAVLGKDAVLAVTADSPSLAREDLGMAIALARTLDLHHRILPTEEVQDPAYRANDRSRCFICKGTLFRALQRIASDRGGAVVLYGAIGDDAAAERPGQQAAHYVGARAPLQEAGLTKWEVRELARDLGLPNWDRPQNACLASRIPHGQGVTEAKLAQIEAAEAKLRACGFRQVRVRHLGTHARIEVDPEALHRFRDAALCRMIVEALERLGFETVGVDRRGYRPGGADRPAEAADEVLLQAICGC